MSKILTISAHPDDSEFYAGGTLLKLTAQNEVVLVVVTNGGKNGLVVTRKAEQNKAGKIIGYQKIIYLNYPDGQLEFNIKKLKRDILKIFLTEKPEIVFSFDTHNQHVVHGDFHPDHRTLANLVVDVALIDATLAKLPRPKLWLFDAFKPNWKVDISQTFKRKILALQQFKSQKLILPNAKFEEFKVY